MSVSDRQSGSAHAMASGRASAEEAPQFLDPRKLWHSLRRRKWLILSIAAIVLAATSVHMLTTTKLYRSSSTVKVRSDDPSPAGVMNNMQLRLYAAKLRQRDLALLVIEKM